MVEKILFIRENWKFTHGEEELEIVDDGGFEIEPYDDSIDA